MIFFLYIIFMNLTSMIYVTVQVQVVCVELKPNSDV